MSVLDSTIMEQRPAQSPHPLEKAESLDLSRLLLSYVACLSPAQQEVLRLKFQSGLSYKEIADVTDKSVNHVGVILHQALKRLKAVVIESGPGLINEIKT